jgi:hypothetical protein
MKSPAVLVAVALAAALAGFAVDRWLVPPPTAARAEDDARARDAEVERLRADLAAAKEREAARERSATLEAATAQEISTLRDALARERAKTATLEAAAAKAAEATASKETAAGVPSKKPRFPYETYQAALAGVDWSSVGSNMKAMVPLLQEFSESMRKGEEMSPEMVGKIQQHNGPLVTVALQVMGKIPGSGANGAFTHPVVMVNAIAATLEAAGLPLTDPQAQALDRVGREWAENDARRLAGYDERAFALQRLIDEVELRDKFFEAAFALLTPEQRDALSPPATRGRTQADLFSSGLVWAAHVQHVAAPSREVFASGVESTLSTLLQPPERNRADLHSAVVDWVASWPKEPFEGPVDGLARRAMWPTSYVLECAKRELTLFQRISAAIPLDDAATRRLRARDAVAIPFRGE